jgi:hypothetical protein
LRNGSAGRYIVQRNAVALKKSADVRVALTLMVAAHEERV